MRLYRHGDAGEPVRDIQDRLAASGFTCDDETGEFGDGTRAAVTSFQRSRSLAADGIVGPETWRMLVESGHRLGGRLLYHRLPMMRGDDVAELQQHLNALGFDAGKVDGIFGPETLTALLDFQANRNMAEDGIAGVEVARELDLVERATHKRGRTTIREREWLRHRPAAIAGLRVFVDAFARDDKEDTACWSAAVAAQRIFQEMGATPVLSRTVDARPPERIRARRANRMGADLVVAFALPRGDEPAVHYFASKHGSSEAGRLLATEIAARIGLGIVGRAVPILKETRPPAVVISAPGMNAALGREAALAASGFFRPTQPS